MYAAGHVKRNPATGEVALRTQFGSPELAEQHWVVSNLASSAKHMSTAAVEQWEDIYVPES
jgi:hypothetical protein